MRGVTLCLLLAATCSGQVLGIWKLSVGRSRFPDGPFPKPITVRYDLQPGAEVWTFYQVRADGFAETISQTLRFDGKEYGCGGLGLEEQPDTVVCLKPDSYTAEVLYNKSGRVARRVVRTVSADGRQMALEIRVTPERGPVREGKLIFER